MIETGPPSVRSMQTSPSTRIRSSGMRSPVCWSTSTARMPGRALPIEPGATVAPGGFAIDAVISVWP
ncbi:hypothetical protein G6F22_022154 [Rhizopus arrhizus]|nr:hypothetical protein G6F22_022154 [Rhizopus arrhizus]